ncbi:hypothetical protein GCM10023238_23660 [Streptomyces heliomycini]
MLRGAESRRTPSAARPGAAAPGVWSSGSLHKDLPRSAVETGAVLSYPVDSTAGAHAVPDHGPGPGVQDAAPTRSPLAWATPPGGRESPPFSGDSATCAQRDVVPVRARGVTGITAFFLPRQNPFDEDDSIWPRTWSPARRVSVDNDWRYTR